MSREVVGKAPASTADDGDDNAGRRSPSEAARSIPRRYRVIVALLALAGIGALAANTFGDHPPAPRGLAAHPTEAAPSPTAGAAFTATLDFTGVEPGRPQEFPGHVIISIDVTNQQSRDRLIQAVSVTGLGVVLPDLSAPEPLPGHTSMFLHATVIADCTARLDPVVRVMVLSSVPGAPNAATSESADVSPGDPTEVLERFCPPMQPGLAVAIVAARAAIPGSSEPPGSVVIRLVNHGRRSAQVTALTNPLASGVTLSARTTEGVEALPLSLPPGRAETLYLQVRRVPRAPCPPAPSAAEGLSLEAGTDDGFTQVTGWPLALIRTAITARTRGCR